MQFSEVKTMNKTGILPPCTVKECKNFLEKKELGIVQECCSFQHYETLRPCKYYEISNDRQT